jgi:hypothetical protein
VNGFRFKSLFIPIFVYQNKHWTSMIVSSRVTVIIKLILKVSETCM